MKIYPLPRVGIEPTTILLIVTACLCQSLFFLAGDILSDEHAQAKLVFLLSTSLILRRVNIIPYFMRQNLFSICFLIDVSAFFIFINSFFF